MTTTSTTTTTHAAAAAAGAASVIDAHAEIDGAARWLRDYLTGARLDRYVIGISGGIDSAVVAMLAARAVGPERLLLVSMPYGLDRPARHPASAQASLGGSTPPHRMIPSSVSSPVFFSGYSSIPRGRMPFMYP